MLAARDHRCYAAVSTSEFLVWESKTVLEILYCAISFSSSDPLTVACGRIAHAHRYRKSRFL